MFQHFSNGVFVSGNDADCDGIWRDEEDIRDDGRRRRSDDENDENFER